MAPEACQATRQNAGTLVLWGVLQHPQELSAMVSEPNHSGEQMAAAAARLPAPLAWPVAALATERDLFRWFFAAEAIFRFVALLWKSAYLAEGQPISAMSHLIRRDLSLPSMGSWQRFCSTVDKRHSAWSWKPELPAVGPLGRAIRKAGNLVELRNAVAHGGLVPDEVAAAEIKRRIEPVIEELIKAACAAFADAELLVRAQPGGGWSSWTGPADTGIPCDGPDVAAPAVLRWNAGTQLLPLYPLVIHSADNASEITPFASRGRIMMFDGVSVRDRHVIYVGRHGRVRAPSWFAAWADAVARVRLPLIPASADELDYDLLRTRFDAALDIALERFDSPWARPTLDDTFLSSLDVAVLERPGQITLVGGVAGAGKTASLCAAASSWRQRQVPVLLLRAVDVDCHVQGATMSTALAAALETTLCLSSSPAELLALAAAQGPVPVLIIDGLDELGSVDRAHMMLDSLVALAEVSRVGIVVATRSAFWDDVLRLDRTFRRNLVDRLRPRLFRPTCKGESGADDASDMLTIRQRHPTEAGEIWESFRGGLAGHQPLSSWSELSPEIREASRNPRWMLSALRAWHGERIPATSSGRALWKAWYCAEVNADHPYRVRAVQRLVELQQQTGRLDHDLADLFVAEDPRRESFGHQLVSSGIWTLGIDPQLPDLGATVEFALPELAVVAWLRLRPLANRDAKALETMALRLADCPAAAILDQALATLIATESAEVLDRWSWVHDAILAEAFLQRAEAGSDPTDLLSIRDENARGELVHRACCLALRSGQVQAVLPALARLLDAEPSWATGPLIWTMARVLRHGERSGIASTLERYIGRSGSTGAHAALALAEYQRECGRWRVAIEWFDAAEARATELPNTLRPLLLAARGECRIWLMEPEAARADLDRAMSQLDESADAFVRCNVHVKRAVAYRLMGQVVRAANDLAAAESLALLHQLDVEYGKVQLEKALVLGLVDGEREGLEFVEKALNLHTRLGFLKGRKKALHCRGWLLERVGRLDEAREDYMASLELNRDPFDRLGLAVNHHALARMTTGVDAAYHRARAARYAAEIGGLPHVDLM